MSRLRIERTPYQVSSPPPHRPCATGGHSISVQYRPDRWVTYVSVGLIDPPCLEAIEKVRRPRTKTSTSDSNQYALGVFAPWETTAIQIRLESDVYRVAAGQYMVINPKQESTLPVQKDFRMVFIGIHQRVLREFRELAGIPSSAGPFDFVNAPHKAAPSLQRLLGNFVDWARQPPQAGDEEWLPIMVYGASFQLLAALWGTHPNALRDRLMKQGYRQTMDIRLRRALEYIAEHYQEALSNDHIAGAAGVSTAHLYDLFKAQFQCSPHEYVRRVRVESAERLLLEMPPSRTRLTEIAKAVGLGRAQSLREAIQAVRGTPPTPHS